METKSNSVFHDDRVAVMGNNNVFHGDDCIIVGDNNVSHGDRCDIRGDNNVNYGDGCRLRGDNIINYGDGCVLSSGQNYVDHANDDRDMASQGAPMQSIGVVGNVTGNGNVISGDQPIISGVRRVTTTVSHGAAAAAAASTQIKNTLRRGPDGMSVSIKIGKGGHNVGGSTSAGERPATQRVSDDTILLPGDYSPVNIGQIMPMTNMTIHGFSFVSKNKTSVKVTFAGIVISGFTPEEVERYTQSPGALTKSANKKA